jgi:hypothetical protein
LTESEQAALRWHGYRSGNRYLVFQVLPHTLGMPPEIWRVLSKAHAVRNVAEYEGHFEADSALVVSLLKAARVVQSAVMQLPVLNQG